MRPPTRHYHDCTGGAAINIIRLELDADNGAVLSVDVGPYRVDSTTHPNVLRRARSIIDAELNDGDPRGGHGADPARQLPRNRPLSDRRHRDQLDQLRADFIDAHARVHASFAYGLGPRAAAARRLVDALDALDAPGDRPGD